MGAQAKVAPFALQVEEAGERRSDPLGVSAVLFPRLAEWLSLRFFLGTRPQTNRRKLPEGRRKWLAKSSKGVGASVLVWGRLKWWSGT